MGPISQLSSSSLTEFEPKFEREKSLKKPTDSLFYVESAPLESRGRFWWRLRGYFHIWHAHLCV